LARVARGRIVLVSLRPIAAGEELTFDYHLTGDGREIACSCGAATCRGRIQQ
jgi:SET domain-containing protein